MRGCHMYFNCSSTILPKVYVPNTITHVLLYFKESQREQALMEALQLFEDKYFLIDTTSEGNVMLGLVAQTLDD
jgi:hypothetical protein